MSVKSIIDQIASDAVIDEAYKWLCKRRKDYHHYDVKGYYEAIDHDCLMDQLKQPIHDPMVLKLLHGYMKHLEDDGGILRPVNRGISLGCPLSPLMAAISQAPG